MSFTIPEKYSEMALMMHAEDLGQAIQCKMLGREPESLYAKMFLSAIKADEEYGNPEPTPKPKKRKNRYDDVEADFNDQAKNIIPTEYEGHAITGDIDIDDAIAFKKSVVSGKQVETPKKRANVVYPEDFEMFWNAYPRKTGKGAAYASWIKKESFMPPVEEVIAKIAELKTSIEWRKEGGQFIPMPQTFLNQHRWEDEVGVDNLRPLKDNEATAIMYDALSEKQQDLFRFRGGHVLEEHEEREVKIDVGHRIGIIEETYEPVKFTSVPKNDPDYMYGMSTGPSIETRLLEQKVKYTPEEIAAINERNRKAQKEEQLDDGEEYIHSEMIDDGLDDIR